MERFLRDMERSGKMFEPVVIQAQQPFSAPHLAILPDMTVILAVPEPMTPGQAYSAEPAPRIPPIFHLQAPLTHTNDSIQGLEFPLPSTSRQRTQTLSLPASLASSEGSDTAAQSVDPPARPSSLPPPPPSFLHNASTPSSQASETSDASHSPQSTTSLATPPPATHASSASSGTITHPFRSSSGAIASPLGTETLQPTLPPQGASAPVLSSRDDQASSTSASKSFSAPVIPVRQPASQPPPHLRPHTGLNILKSPVRASASGRASPPPPAAPATGPGAQGSPATSTPSAAAVGPVPVMAGPNAISAQSPSLAEQIERAIFAATRASTDPAPVGPPPRRTLGVGLGGHSLSSWPPGDLSTIPEGPASDAESSHALGHSESQSGSEPSLGFSVDASADARAGAASAGGLAVPPWPLPTVSVSAAASSASTGDPAFVTAPTAATDDDSARLSSAHSSVAVPGTTEPPPRDTGSIAASNSIEFAPQPELTFGDFGETTSLRFVPADVPAGDGSAGIAASGSVAAAADTCRESSSSIPLGTDALPDGSSARSSPLAEQVSLLPEMSVQQMSMSPVSQDAGGTTRLPLPASQSPSRYSESMPSSSRDANMPPYTIGPSSSEGVVPGSIAVPEPDLCASGGGPVPSPRITDLSLQGRDSAVAAAAAAAARAARHAEIEGLSSSGVLNSISTQDDQSSAGGLAADGGDPRAAGCPVPSPGRRAGQPGPAALVHSVGPRMPSPPPSQDVDSGPLSGIHPRPDAAATPTAAQPPAADAAAPQPLPAPPQSVQGRVAAAAAAAAAAQFDSLSAESLPSITRRGAVLALGTASYEDSASLRGPGASSADASFEASLMPCGSDGLPTPTGSDPWLISDPPDAAREAAAAVAAAVPASDATVASSIGPEAAVAAPTASAYPANVPSPIGAAAAAVTLSPERIPSQLAGAKRKDHRPGSLSAIPVAPRATGSPAEEEHQRQPKAEPAAAGPVATAAKESQGGSAASSVIPAPPKGGATAAEAEPAEAAAATRRDPQGAHQREPAAAEGAGGAQGEGQPPPQPTALPASRLPAVSAGVTQPPPMARPFFSVRGLLVRLPTAAIPCRCHLDLTWAHRQGCTASSHSACPWSAPTHP